MSGQPLGDTNIAEGIGAWRRMYGQVRASSARCQVASGYVTRIRVGKWRTECKELPQEV